MNSMALKGIFFVLLISCIPVAGNAGTASGKVTKVYAHSMGGNGSGVFMFSVEGARSNAPICSTAGGGKEWAMSLEKEAGRAMYALVLSAQAQGKTVFVHGGEHCDSWADREQPIYIILAQ